MCYVLNTNSHPHRVSSFTSKDITFTKKPKIGLLIPFEVNQILEYSYIFKYGNVLRSRLLCFEAVVFWLLAPKSGFEAKYFTSKLALASGLCFSLQILSIFEGNSSYSYFQCLTNQAFIYPPNTKAFETLLLRVLKSFVRSTHKPFYLCRSSTSLYFLSQLHLLEMCTINGFFFGASRRACEPICNPEEAH